jgi:putative aldouronate transport system substrate-binding protein
VLFASSTRSRSRRVRTVAATFAAFATALGLTTACGSSDEAGDDNVIKIFASQSAQMDLNSNSFTRHLEKKFNVDLRFETTSYEASSATEARQISLAGGDLPDAYMLVAWATQFNQSELLRYGQQGLLVPLNDLIEQHAPNIQAAFEEEPDFEKFSTAPDGTIWGLPQWNDCYHCSYPYKFWINTEWLDNLGLEMPTTPEEFFDVMVAFKEDDPNGNGKADEIPLTGNTQNSLVPFIMNAFIYNAFNTGVVGQPVSLGLNGDTVQVQAAQDGWREGLQFLNRMWEADLIDPAAFSQGPDTMQATGNSAEGVMVGGATVMHPGLLVTMGQEDGRDNQYDPLPPLNGPAGDAATYVLPSTPGATFVVTSAASEAKQQTIVEIMNYIFSPEGHRRAQFGEEGIGWREPKPDEIALDESLEPVIVDIPTDEDNPADYNGNWGPMSQVFDTEEWRNTQVQPMDIYTLEGAERRFFEATGLYEGKETDAMFPYWNVWIPLEDGSELSTLLTNVETYIATSTAEFVTGVRDPNSDGDWQSYLDGMDGLGVDRYLEIWQNAYDAS